MKNLKRKIRTTLCLLICLVTFFAAVPVSAAMDDATKDTLSAYIPSYLEQVFSMDEESIEAARESGGFGEVLADALEDNQSELGALKSVDEVSIDDSDDEQIMVSAQCSFEKHDAEVVLYLSEDGSSVQNLVINIAYPLSVKLVQAGQNTAVGLIVVFIVLIFLSLVISLFKLIPSGKKEKNSEASVSAPKAAPVAPAATKVSAAQDEEIAAVIAAAIAAAESESASGSGYVVRSIKRCGSSKNWKRV